MGLCTKIWEEPPFVFFSPFGLKTLGYDAETYEMLGRNLWVMMKETMSCGGENYDLGFLT